ncbi:MAG TPA: hypothetical protein VLT87_24765 [Thermoanaerobaculia bacterium]|nr:hypothetical protein [Thermoanaerobaculia bacterium]
MRDDELLRRFLLGELAEDEVERLERRLLQEDALFELCEAIEGDLFAASVRGELTPAENERVLTHLAASPGGRARLALARELVEAAKPDPVLLRFRRAVKALPPWAGPFAAVAASLLLTVGIYRSIPPAPDEDEVEIVHEIVQPRDPVVVPVEPPPPPPAPSEEKVAESTAPPQPAPATERPPVPEPAPRLTTAVFQLALAGRRSAEPAEELPRFAVPKGTGEIDIQLDLGGEEREFLTFNALVTNPEAGEVWRGQGLEPQSLDWGTALILKIPAESLPDGRYTMKVQGLKAEGEAETIGVQEFEIVAD